MSTSRVFLITGCSSGLGLALARSVLKEGHRLIATSRDPSATPDAVKEIESAGAVWLPLDTAATTLDAQFSAALNVYGRVDVLVNNAGIGVGGALEDSSIDSARKVMEVNFFGVVRLTKLVLPYMREQGSGTIVNISSAVVSQTPPGLSLYAASKWAVEGFSESIASEVAPFRVKVLLAVPAGMRTKFTSLESGRGAQFAQPSAAYQQGPVAYVHQMLQDMDGKQPIDPSRAGQRIIEAILGRGVFAEEDLKDSMFRLLIGRETAESREAWLQKETAAFQSMQAVSTSCDFDTA